jgi:hypothetical protein
MMIWKCSLFQTILDSYSLKEHLITNIEGHVPIVGEVGKVVEKKN